jgi:hypothetical protein
MPFSFASRFHRSSLTVEGAIMKSLLIGILAAISLAGCAVYAPPPGVYVTPGPAVVAPGPFWWHWHGGWHRAGHWR